MKREGEGEKEGSMGRVDVFAIVKASQKKNTKTV